MTSYTSIPQAELPIFHEYFFLTVKKAPPLNIAESQTRGSFAPNIEVVGGLENNAIKNIISNADSDIRRTIVQPAPNTSPVNPPPPASELATGGVKAGTSGAGRAASAGSTPMGGDTGGGGRY